MHTKLGFYSPGGSSNLQLRVFAEGLTPKSLLPLGSRTPPNVQYVSLHLTSVSAKWHVNPSNGLSRVHECDRRQTDDRPRYGEMCIWQ